MRMLGGLFYRLFFFGGSLPLCLFVALAAPFSRTAVRAGASAWAGWFVWCARVFTGVKVAVRGAIPNEGAIVALKHSSAFETFLTLHLFDMPAVVMKAELRKIPLWGFIADRHGSIFVERGKAGAALKAMIREAKARAAEGRPILIFPEGTRVPVGEAPPLKAGLYALYGATDLPVVPVALDSGPVWPKGWAKGPGTVTFAFAPDVPTGLAREAMEAAVHAAINADPRTCAVRMALAPAASAG
jgi:1-acyl-sn-glycerol-3-phosphate acyltransferase